MATRGSTNEQTLPIIDGYTIEGLLDTGGFSRVYLATQHGLDRPVAIKVLNTTFDDERQQSVFDRECKVMGQLSSHPNIVTVFASTATNDKRPCIVMELYDGTYRTEGVLDIREVVNVGAQVADALQTIHDHGIVHRDIKPHNVFISSGGVPAVGDFGISSIEDERTMTGAAGFSINYAPPEVFEEGGAGAAGDIYSLGATLYQLATDEVPFPHHGDQTDRVRATVHKIISAPPPQLSAAGTPPALDLLLRRCMAKSISDRPASPDAVATELRRIQREIGLPDRRARTTDEPRRLDGGTHRTVARNDPGTENRTVLREVTPRPAPKSTIEDPDSSNDPQRPGPKVRRNVLIGAAAALALVIGGYAITAGDGAAPIEATATSPPPTVGAATEVVILRAPTDVTVTAEDDGSLTIDWVGMVGDVKYQINQTGTSNTRVVDAPPYNWVSDPDSASQCFTIRTLDAAETKMSQSATAPACPS